ncbi:Arylsulfatase [Rosistilla carotiformis]|uniref:Arylsulfatase n=1 Tax=Rosistilla carotiformis TaxID=2528017 RepID=A0A518JUI8_9BACT|nr:sulfatase [Rosistilla carotiformis]QDV69214.1 Arylsulfatase [Rosistilla carotiformis]
MVNPSKSRRMFLAGLLVATCASLVPATETGLRDRPNVLFIAVDDLACTLGCYGDLVAKTPNIDRLAAEGTCFQRAYNQLPLCNPTRASVMTGRRPDEIKVYDLDRHFRDELPDVVTLPQAFQAAGYFAARVGKIYHYNVPASIGTDGFDDPPSWNRTVNPKGRDKIDEALVFNAEPHRKISGALSWLAADGEDEEQTDGIIASEAIEIMREKRDLPFFLGVGFFRPHTPYVAPKKYFEMYPLESLRLPYAPPGDRDDIPTAAFAHNCPVPNYGLDHQTLLQATQAYYACVSFVDAQVGRLLDAVEELGLAEETIVVFWSDHGYHLGEHDGVWQKRTLFEQGARAPLIVRVPGQKSQGECRRIVEFVDIYPTLTDLAQIPSPSGLAGRSLLPLIENRRADWDGYAVTQVLRPADARLSEPVMGCSLRTARYRFTEWGEGKHGVELYDHQSDPNEFHNLAVQPDAAARAVIDRLRPLLRSKASGKTPTVPVNPDRL